MKTRTAVLREQGWINIYGCFSQVNIWPRGFPLNHVQKPSSIDEPCAEIELMDCPIQQGLCNENPDVDAVYRLVMPLPQNLEKSDPVALGEGSWCPFNSQNTMWFRPAFPLMYLPAHCSFRMTDIWRSFVAQRIAWTNEWGVLFRSPTVRQERNEHNLMKDFADEVSGYLNNERLCAELADLKLLPGETNIPDNLRVCYTKMVEMELVGEAELPLLDTWLDDLSTVL